VKKISFILLAVAVLAVLMSGTALANFGPHGGYAQDTDACAGCHRAHTAFSAATWTTLGTTPSQKSALLVISAGSTMTEACYACHGDGAPGASTNVQSGIFDSGPSGSSTSTPVLTYGQVNPSGNTTSQAGVGTPGGVTLLYNTQSSYLATLNGGGFDHLGGSGTVSSSHQMDKGSATAPMWGNGSSLPAAAGMTCADCHDPHGSSNYRLLRDTLGTPAGNIVVGGYNASGTPNPFVISAEQGYPANGWLKGNDGASQLATYLPDYTTYKYKVTNGANPAKSFSAWCAGCHTVYNQTTSAYNYLSTIGGPASGTSVTYHRHPVETSLMAGDPNNVNRALPTALLIDSGLPLQKFGSTGNPYQDYLTCLTCHFAHGTEATMSGWAAGGITTVTISGNPTAGPFQDATYEGVQPTFNGSTKGTSALLRYNNRGVCERCHNK
jgi:predicted CXXCH cytochrome family protein